MRGLVFFNMHHVIFGLAVHVKKMKQLCFEIFESEEIGWTPTSLKQGKRQFRRQRRGPELKTLSGQYILIETTDKQITIHGHCFRAPQQADCYADACPIDTPHPTTSGPLMKAARSLVSCIDDDMSAAVESVYGGLEMLLSTYVLSLLGVETGVPLIHHNMVRNS